MVGNSFSFRMGYYKTFIGGDKVIDFCIGLIIVVVVETAIAINRQEKHINRIASIVERLTDKVYEDK